jgi:hypothetical protein
LFQTVLMTTFTAAWCDGAATSSQLLCRLWGYYRAKNPLALDVCCYIQ